MPRKIWTEEMYRYLREISPGRYNTEIAEMVNKKFGFDFTIEQIRNAKSRKKIKSCVSRHKPNPDEGMFNAEQKEFIKNNVKGLFNQELADLVNKKFKLSVTAEQIRIYKQNHNLISGINTQFKKGHKPWNKGMKGLQIGGKETQFKKGQSPINYMPIGTERIDSKYGYTLVKVRDDGPLQGRWKHKHVVLWESVNGPVPAGYVVAFADQDKSNITLENLILVSRKQLALMNKNGYFQKNADLTKTGLVMADIHLKIGELKRVVTYGKN